jgi:hypothetical protein
VVAGVLAGAAKAEAAEYYVATTGSDSNPGSMSQPFASMQKGADVAAAGDTVWIRGGTYSVVTPDAAGAGITFSKSGTSEMSRIKYFAYPGEVPVFNFSKMVLSTTGYTHGFVVTGSWLHFKGLEICYVLENTRSNNAVAVNGGGNDIFELLNMHHNMGNGIFIGKGSGGHLVLNCDAHDNYDPMSAQGDGQNADGFGVHYQTSGASTILRGCNAWWNSDDGYDLINQEVPVVVENSWAMGNGYTNAGTMSPASGNGNGFKMGSSATAVRHIVRNNVAWKNKAAGFYANHSSGGNTWYNNTSYNNGTQYNMLASPANDSATTIILSGALAHVMRNNIGFPNKNTNMGGVDTASNTWDLAITPAAADFLSVTDTGYMGPRQVDGSLPKLDFMRLAAGSKMIDKGVNVGLPFAGASPDLGAYEYGAVTATGGASSTGGASGTGGSAANGGSVSGGSSNRGGATATGGVVSSGGTTSGGGATASGGATGGASVMTGGAAATGGSVSAGGAATSATGGTVSATGGALTTQAGGTTASGGVSSANNPDSTTSGCGCKVVGLDSNRAAASSWAVLGVLGVLCSIRRGRTRTPPKK